MIRNFTEGWLINKITEKEIVKIWQYQLFQKEGLATTDGESLEIIYPGRPNDDRGADFREAVIVTGKKLARGDVEIHVNSAGWHAHGHDGDAFYNRVILHVVMWPSANAVTKLQNGREVPVFALEKYFDTSLIQGSNIFPSPAGSKLPCFSVVLRREKSAICELLDKAGEERCLAKARGFRKGLAVTEAGQVLYQAFMGALGYSRNKLPFLELARRLPLRCLESVEACDVSETGAEFSRDDWIAVRQALLLETAGLPSRHFREYPGCDLIGRWADVAARSRVCLPATKPVSAAAWNLLRVRPNNSPVLRLAAMSHLLFRYRGRGLLEGLVGLIREAPLGKKGCKCLEAGLVVSIDGVMSAQGRSRVTLLGAERAADILVDVLLPFTVAVSRFVSEPESGDKALALYHLYPRLTLNSVEKHMAAQLGLDSKLVDSARRQQGLIHIYHQLCSLGRCVQCPLSHSNALVEHRT